MPAIREIIFILNKNLFTCLVVLSAFFVQEVSAVDYTVNDMKGLKNAISAANPGDVITLEDGQYDGGLSITDVSGSADNPITLQGGKGAIFTNAKDKSIPIIAEADFPGGGSSISMVGSSYWVFKGFTIAFSQRGLIVQEGSDYNTFDDLVFHDFTRNACKIRRDSSFNVVKNCEIYNCGMGLENDKNKGEGVYIGTAIAPDKPFDQSNGNQILNCYFHDITSIKN